MAVNRVCYATREAVKRALDFRETARNNDQIDRAIESGADYVDGDLNRSFFPQDGTCYFDWPNYETNRPWKIYLDQNELAAPATQILSGTVSIPIADVNFEPANYGPPYRWIELRLDKSDSFGHSSTPQRDVAITGTFGFWTRTTQAGSLAAAITDTTSLTLTISNGSLVGVGDMVIVGTERMLVSDRSMIDTTITFSGPPTASLSDNLIAVPDSTMFGIGEVILLDAERMLIVDTYPTTLVVKRAWDGTQLATHTSGTIYASRRLTLAARGGFGTVAATHLIAAAVVKNYAPALVRDYALAIALDQLLEEGSGYARMASGPSDAIRPPTGVGLDAIAARACATYGRKNRQRAV
jgi:hypothetical protein